MQTLFARSNYGRAMGFRLVEAGGGSARIECLVSENHENTQGVCHGGVISGLMDMAAGVAAKSMQGDPQCPVATLSLTVNYQRPGELGRTLSAEATIQSGRRILSCSVTVARRSRRANCRRYGDAQGRPQRRTPLPAAKWWSGPTEPRRIAGGFPKLSRATPLEPREAACEDSPHRRRQDLASRCCQPSRGTLLHIRRAARSSNS